MDMEETRNEQITETPDTDAAKKTEETTGTQGAENTDGQANQNEASGEKGEKTFTQAEVNKLIKERLAREKAAKAATESEELEAIKRELKEFKAKNSCYRAGVRDEFVQDVMTLAAASVDETTDFETALEAVLKKYPAFIKSEPITTGKKIESKKEEVSNDTLRKALGLK
jgi:hypothetical protein